MADQSDDAPLPDYPKLIMAAVEELSGGASKSDISKHIEGSVPGDLPSSHDTLLTYYLDKMNQSGQIAVKNHCFVKADPSSAPARRGRGRPPKPKAPLPPGYVPPPPRPRGRPPKPRDQFAPAMKKASAAAAGGSGRKRGRPPKSAAVAPPPPPAAPTAAPTRGRGRPPKVNSAMSAAPVGA